MVFPLRHPHRWFVIAVLGALAILWAAMLVVHAEARRPWNDEAMLATPGMNLVQHGHLGTAALEPRLLPHIDRRTYWIFPLNLVALAGWYKIFGFSLLTVRLFSMLWTLVLLLDVYILASHWTNSRTVGLLATVICGFDYNIMVAGSFGRYDPMVAALGFGAYAAYLVLREKNLLYALLASNVLIAACGATHPNGLMFFIGLLFLVFYLDRKALTISLIALSAIPYLVTAIGWGAYLLQDLPSAMQQLKVNSYSRVTIFAPLAALLGELERYQQAMGLTRTHSAGAAGPLALKALPWVIYFIGALGVLFNKALRTRPGIRTLLAIAALHFFYMTFFEGMKFPFYLEHIIPLYAILLAIFTHRYWGTGSRSAQAIVFAGCALAILIGVAGVAQRIRVNTYRNMYAPVVEFVRNTAKPTDMVMASCDFGFGYGFGPNLVDDIRLGYYSGKIPSFIVIEESYAFNFDIWKTKEPALYHFIINRLNEYDLIYDHASYRVYQRRASAAPPTGIPTLAATN